LRQESNDEKTHKMAKFLVTSTAGLIPGAGGLISSSFDLLVGDPAIKRLTQFVEGLAERLEAMEREGLLTIENLTGKREASALFLQAIQASMRADGARKVEGLKNVAANGASYKPEDRYISFIVLQILDRITEAHISMLSHLNKLARRTPIYWSQGEMSGVRLSDSPKGMTNPVKGVDSSYHDSREVKINRIILHDLAALGLVHIGLEIPDSIEKWSTEASENGQDTLTLTDLGRLVVDEMSDEPVETFAGDKNQ